MNTPAVRGPIIPAAALRSFQGQNRTPGTSGSKGARYFSFQVSERAPIVRPWNAPSNAISSVRPEALPMRRANLMAASTLSVPEFVKKTRAGNAAATRRSASVLTGSLK